MKYYIAYKNTNIKSLEGNDIKYVDSKYIESMHKHNWNIMYRYNHLTFTLDINEAYIFNTKKEAKDTLLKIWNYRTFGEEYYKYAHILTENELVAYLL
jgi:hypothetical protein